MGHKIYLAGSMEKAGEYGRTWRKEITPYLLNLGYTVWNPYKEEKSLGINPQKLKEMKTGDFGKFHKTCQFLVDFDIDHLLSCDVVVARLDKYSAGTYGELTICKHYNIPVYAWIDFPQGKYGVPSWVIGCITEFAETKDDFYSIIPPVSPKSSNKSEADIWVEIWKEYFSDR